ncbi:MAG: bifunctional tetrahydrofolate synthase/dihydrofolate synthase [Candidatus Oxydemutatoraceae bacterium WSBS_2016_MAG_OTU14]
MKHEKLSDWLAWQEKLHPTSIDLGLERVHKIVSACGLDQVEIPVILVAGTNGKGSTVAILSSILQAQNYRVACYTSPHFLHYNERIAIDGVPVEDDLICTAFEFIEQRREGISLSFFEFGTLAALYCFQQYELDCMILEVGLGGRLDAVNVIDPTVAVITSIGIDHVQWLGKDRESIAKEKAGIMRANIPVICGDPHPPQAIADVAKQCGAVLYQLGVNFDYQEHESVCDYHFNGQAIKALPKPSLFGQIQLNNTATALMALHCLKDQLPISDEAIRQGLSQIQLLGRFQVIMQKPMKIFDIAHNPDGAKILAKNLVALPCTGQTYAVFGVLADKDVSGILQAMGGLVDGWYLAKPKSSRGLQADELKQMVLVQDKDAIVSNFAAIGDAYRGALNSAKGDDRVLVFGSMVTVAEALATDL